MKRIAVLTAIILITSLALISCSESVNDASGKGRIKMYLVDAPVALDSVVVNVIRVEVHSTAFGWVVINDSVRYFDLLQLTNGVSAVLGDEFLAAGRYTQIRLILGDDNYLYSNGIKFELEVASSEQTGIKLIHPFEILPDNLYELYLDFNVDKSIHITGSGKYMMRPTIRIQAAVISGTISGQLLQLDADATIWTVAGTDTITTYTDGDGNFKLMCLPAGTYEVNIDPADQKYSTKTISDVGVYAQQNTDLGVISLE
jgi:hypothetical protein